MARRRFVLAVTDWSQGVGASHRRVGTVPYGTRWSCILPSNSAGDSEGSVQKRVLLRFRMLQGIRLRSRRIAFKIGQGIFTELDHVCRITAFRARRTE